MAPPAQPPHPTLRPQLCLAPNSLRAFLRLSRAAIDDPISQHLSSLSNPSSAPFDAASISAARSANLTRRGLPSATCAGFVSHTLFPAWAARARVLEYCADVAQKEISSDGRGDVVGDSLPRGSGRSRWGGIVSGGSLALGAGVVGPEANVGDEQSQRPSLGPDGQALSISRHPKVVDERVDPYSARDYDDESPGERLVRVIKEERSIETIIRSRSWGVIKDRCGTAIEGWEEGMKQWEVEMGKAQDKGKRDVIQADTSPGWKGLWN